MKKLSLILLLLPCSTFLLAADKDHVTMADKLYNSGYIYVVVAVIAVIFAGLAIYLFTIDSRLKKIESENEFKY